MRDNNPVVIFEEQLIGMSTAELPEEDYTIPIGKGLIKRPGKDVTLVATGAMVLQALYSADKFEREGISVEIIDPRTLFPLDKELILDSVKKTGKLVIFDDAPRFCGFASEVSATVAEEGFELLKAPIMRVTRDQVPMPFSPTAEAAMMANDKKLLEALQRVRSKTTPIYFLNIKETLCDSKTKLF